MEDDRSLLSPLLFPDPDGATDETFGLIVTEKFAQRAVHATARFVAAGLLQAGEANRIGAELRARAVPFRLAWHYSAGLFDDPQLMADAPERCLDQLMLSLAGIGLPIDHCFLSRAAPLYTADDWRIPEGAAEGIVRNGAGPLFRVRGDTVAARNVAGAMKLPVLDRGDARLTLMPAEYADPFFAGSIDFSLMATASLPQHRLGDALDELEALAPRYHRWCTQALTSAIPLDPGVTSMSSGSQGSCPGMIYLSATLDPVKTAEMLIHEASHQYFRGIEALGRLTAGDDTEEFYSPVVGRKRPLPKLLLAYHAFANVLAYMVEIRPAKSGQKGAFVERNIATVAADLETLAEGIEASTTLNRNGKAIWAEMRETVRGALMH